MPDSTVAVKPQRSLERRLQSPAKKPGTQVSPVDRSLRTGTQASSLDQSQRSATAVTRAGYPQRGRTNPVASNRADIEDFSRKLEKLKAQTRQLRTQEAQLRANISREETDAHGQVKADEEKTIMDWRQQQSRLMQKAEADRRREQREKEIKDSRKLQEGKRLTREAAQQEEIRLANSSYTESLEAAQHVAERKKTQPIVDEQLRVAANLEKYRTFAEYEFIEKERQKEDERALQLDRRLSEMEQAMAKAKREQELAAENLQCVSSTLRTGKQVPNRTRTGPGRRAVR